MIVLAILLVSLFSVSLAGLLPAGRDYTIDITHNETLGEPGTIWLYHKGGDWVEKSELEVMVISGKTTTTIPSTNSSSFHLCTDENSCDSQTFNLGDCIRIEGIPLHAGDTIRLVSPRNVIFSGTAS